MDRQKYTDSHINRSKSLTSNQKGRFGEEHIARLLERKGFLVVSRNFRSRYSEIDIIASKGRNVVFVEVKTTNSTRRKINDLIGQRKIGKIWSGVQTFVTANPKYQSYCQRIVIALVTTSANGRNNVVKWVTVGV